MASSNIKLFDENKGNMLTDTEFNISNQRLNGLQTGVASSQLQNKAMYQASLVAYAIAQVMMQNGLNANDTDAVSAFVANLSGTMLQKVYDIATTEEAKAGVATGKWMSPALTKALFDYRKATTSEAQNATDDTKWMSPALVRAAFNYIKATTAEAQAGTNDTKWMSPALVKTAINYVFGNSKATTSEAQAGTNNTKWMSPALVKAAIDTLAAKAQNILSNGTKSKYGLSSDKTPNDVFSLMSRFNSGLGNEYLWRKDTYSPYKEKRIGPYNSNIWNTFPGGVYYGTGISISDTGVVTLLNPVLVGNNAATVAQQINRKYIQWSGAEIRYIQSATAQSNRIVQTFYVIKAERQVTSSTWLNSPSPTGYPEGGSGNEVYTFLGRIGDCAHIEVGSYYGTGSAQSITFPFVPRLMFINYELVSFSVSGRTATISDYTSSGQTYSYICIGGS